MSKAILSYQRVTHDQTTPKEWLLFLHGTYGSGRNWSSIARQIVAKNPDKGGLLVDLREHGESGSFPKPHTLEEAANDIEQLIDHLQLSTIEILGHSFGGKVALSFIQHQSRTIKKVWIIDSTPESFTPQGSAWEMLKILQNLPDSFSSRDEAIQLLESNALSKGVARWMAMNLRLQEKQYRWRLNLQAIESLLLDFFHTDFWSVIESSTLTTPIHFIKAKDSSILSKSTVTRIQNTKNTMLHLQEIEGGHWLHIDNAKKLLSLLLS